MEIGVYRPASPRAEGASVRRRGNGFFLRCGGQRPGKTQVSVGWCIVHNNAGVYPLQKKPILRFFEMLELVVQKLKTVSCPSSNVRRTEHPRGLRRDGQLSRPHYLAFELQQNRNPTRSSHRWLPRRAMEQQKTNRRWQLGRRMRRMLGQS